MRGIINSTEEINQQMLRLGTDLGLSTSVMRPDKADYGMWRERML